MGNKHNKESFVQEMTAAAYMHNPKVNIQKTACAMYDIFMDVPKMISQYRDDQAKAAQAEKAAEAAALANAAALYRGDFLAGFHVLRAQDAEASA